MTEGTLQLDPRSATRDDMVREAEDIMSHSPNSNVSEDESLIIDVDSDMQDIDESSCSSMAETKDGLMMQMTSPKSNSGESNDQQGPSPSQEARRSSIDPARQAALNTLYATALYPSSGQFDRITEETGLSLKTVKQWFQNRRSKDRKMPHKESSPSESARNVHAAKTGHKRSISSSDDSGSQSSELNMDGSTSRYQPMTQVALPPDHPFCQLLEQTRQASRRHRPSKTPAQSGSENASTPVARPLNARCRGKAERRRHRQKVLNPSKAISSPVVIAPAVTPPSVATKPEASQQLTTTPLWRPMTLPSSPPSAPTPARSESPLDLSVTLKKRKRHDGISPQEEAKPQRSPQEHIAGRVTSRPLMYPGVAYAPGYYNPLGQTLMASLPQLGYPMSQLPLSFYGQSPIWGHGMPRFSCVQSMNKV